MRNRVLLVGGLTALVAVCLAVAPEIWIYSKSRDVRPGARPAVRASLKAYLWSKVTGSYWENAMLREAQAIRGQPLPERLDFYRAVILCCELDTSRALFFAEAVGDDADALRDDLRAFAGSPQFGELSGDRRRRVDAWLAELEVVGQERRRALAAERP